ncbi:MAG TPA: nitrogenase molybdenum-iron protein alpha chain [Nitrospirae bacterium]|nr:nitrogenase molybdenum-iron protein alpha chain [Nitrospirota bacterium]
MSGLIEKTQKMIDEVLEAYPERTKKFRSKHVKPNDPTGECGSACMVKSNVKSRPGVMTIRGCAYAGSKGVVWGPVKDVVHLSHGPVGCGQYSWWSRRNYYNGITGIDSFGTMHITSDFQERDIVFGGDKRLEKLCREIRELFPLAKGISIQSECPIGLIGDDIEAVAKKMTKELGIPVVPVRCEGFRGVSQSLGHHIANDSIRDHILGRGELDRSTPYDVALIGDYNIGGDAWATRRILEEMGLRVIAHWTGDGTIKELSITQKAKLNLIHCYRSMNYICRHMEETYGIPWVEYNFFGPTKIYQSIRKIASYFDDRIKENAEKLIEKYKPMMDRVIEQYRPRLEGKTVMLYVGGLRPRHIIGAYEDLGMEVIATGYEFGHNDDYKRTYPELKEGALIYDDATPYELEEFTKRLRPDLVGSGIKEKYAYHKLGVPFRQMHSWDYSGPYHGFDGFPVFARDMDMTVNNPTWKLIRRKKFI